MVGNNYAFELFTGKQDAFIGLLLAGDGRGNFKAMRVDSSGFYVDGDAKGLASLVREDGSSLILVTQNNDRLVVFEHNLNAGLKVIKPKPLEYRARMEFQDGTGMIKDLFYGSSYLSSSSRSFVLPGNVSRVTLYSYTGESREVVP